MNICVAAHAFVRHPDDLIGSFVLRLAAGIAEQGTKVTVVAPHAHGLSAADTIGPVQIVRFRYAPATYERIAYQGNMHELVQRNTLNKALLGCFMAAFTTSIVHTVRRNRCDLIHAHWWFPSGLAAAVAATITGIPLVITCHGTDVRLLGRQAVVDTIARWVLGRAAAVTAVSSYLAEALSACLPTLRGRIPITPMPIDSVFTGNGPHAPPPGQPRILAAGRLSRQKRFHDLIEATAILAQHGVAGQVLLIGNGEQERALRKLAAARNLGDRVAFLGSKTPRELATYYRTCHVAVLPSHDEGLGLTLVEAMFCGTPVIGADSGGIRDLIADGETGLLVPSGDPPALADAIQRVITNPDLAQRLGQAGKKHVQAHFAPAACIERMMAVYQNALQRRR